MTKALWISTYQSISNPDALAAYGKLAGPALLAAGGRFLARGIPTFVKEGGLMQRTVVVEFDSVDQAKAAYDSPAYKEALVALGTGNVVRDIRIIEQME
jgi:uncharacterized protein (DUF1330 family)